MRAMTPETLASLRERFPQGAQVELLRMDDPQAPPIGTKGTVRSVDDWLHHGGLGQRRFPQCAVRRGRVQKGGRVKCGASSVSSTSATLPRT